MALMQVTIIPLGTKSTSLSKYVADIQDALEKENAIFELNDMGTTIQGEANELLTLAAKIHDLPFQKGAQRVVTQIVLDDRRDRKVALGDKVAAVREHLKKSSS